MLGLMNTLPSLTVKVFGSSTWGPQLFFPQTTRKTMHMVMGSFKWVINTQNALKVPTRSKDKKGNNDLVEQIEKVNQNDQLCHYQMSTDLFEIRASIFHFPSEKKLLLPLIGTEFRGTCKKQIQKYANSNQSISPG